MMTLEKLRVVIADDHPLLLQGLKETLMNSGINVVASAFDGTTTLQLIIDHQPQLAVLDIEMPYLSGFDVALECRKRGIGTKFIILSYHKEAEFVAQAKKLNISGYLLKEDTSRDIMHCIHEVMNDREYYSHSLLKNDLDIADDLLRKLSFLSPSEKKILKLIAAPLSSQEIAEKLHVSERTVEKHRSNIIAKLDLSGQSNSLSRWTIENKSIISQL